MDRSEANSPKEDSVSSTASYPTLHAHPPSTSPLPLNKKRPVARVGPRVSHAATQANLSFSRGPLITSFLRLTFKQYRDKLHTRLMEASDQYQAYAEQRPFLWSSPVDFPEQHSSGARYYMRAMEVQAVAGEELLQEIILLTPAAMRTLVDAFPKAADILFQTWLKRLMEEIQTLWAPINPTAVSESKKQLSLYQLQHHDCASESCRDTIKMKAIQSFARKLAERALGLHPCYPLHPECGEPHRVLSYLDYGPVQIRDDPNPLDPPAWAMKAAAKAAPPHRVYESDSD